MLQRACSICAGRPMSKPLHRKRAPLRYGVARPRGFESSHFDVRCRDPRFRKVRPGCVALCRRCVAVVSSWCRRCVVVVSPLCRRCVTFASPCCPLASPRGCWLIGWSTVRWDDWTSAGLRPGLQIARLTLVSIEPQPLPHLVSPYGASPKAPVAAAACGTCAPFTRFVALEELHCMPQ